MPTRGIDFATMTLRDALDLGILVEEEARDRYLELAEQMTQFRTPKAASLFEKMASYEELHRRELLERRRAEGFTGEPKVHRSMLFDVEAPEYDEARAFMTPHEAVEVALKSEMKAHEFFFGLMSKVKDGVIRRLFGELAREEHEHQALLLAELDRLPPADQVQGDVGDEPVAL